LNAAARVARPERREGRGLPVVAPITSFRARHAIVILGAAKNLAWNRRVDEILRYAQNDGIDPVPML
jgi:hypothetical protein